MNEAAKAAGLSLFVAYYRRALPDFLTVKELVESGAIGEVRFVSVTLTSPPRKGDLTSDNRGWRVNPGIAGGGHFFDLGSHQLDFLDFVFGPIVSVRGQAANQAELYPAEDIVCANFAFESGVVGSGIWCFTVSEQNKTDRTEIVGTKGKITFSTFDPMPVQLETDQGLQEFQAPLPEHVQQPLIQTVVDELRRRGKCPSTGITAARTNHIMDNIVVEYYKK